MTPKARQTSITKRLFLYSIAVILGISALILLSNTLLLKPLYYCSIRNTMIRAMDSLSLIDFSEKEDVWLDKLEAQTVGKSYDLIIGNEETVLFSSSAEAGLMPRPDGSVNNDGQSDAEEDASRQDIPEQNVNEQVDQEDRQPRMENQLFFWPSDRGNWETVGENTFMATIKEPRMDIEMLVCTKELDNGIKIALTQAIEPINQSVRQSNILLVACALLSLAVSVVFVFKVSKRFTQPIRQIKNTVGELAALNFGHKCDVRTRDELQSLGEDINRLGNELENALNTLRSQNLQLEKDIIAQRQFISNASHELRTPLSLIKGYADEMNMGYAQDKNQKDHYIEIIAEEAAKMNRLLKEMLELSRMESGRIELIYEKLSVNECINSFLEKYDGFLSENGLNVTLKLEEESMGYFDAMRFEQVLANYISNAARYGDLKKEVRITTHVKNDVIRIGVFNSGQSIPEDHLESIWNGFFKADDARTRIEDSYGLGLSVVKAIQNVAGQRFGAENTSGGVEFWFEVQRNGELL